MNKLLAGAALALALAGPPAAAQRMPQPVDAAERAALPEVARALTSRIDLATLDRLLAQLAKPTPLRGVLQSARAGALLYADRTAEAKLAAEEAVRLTPDFAPTRLTAAYVLVFAGTPQAAANYWLEAAAIDPEATRQTDPYYLKAIVERLNERGDRALADKVRARADEIGVLSALAPDRSSAALSRFRAAVDTRGVAAGQPLLSAIIAPGDMSDILLDRRYASLWPAAVQWAGPDLGALRRRYLEELRREWWAQRDFTAAANYARALNASRAYAATAALFAPLLAKVTDVSADEGVFFLAPPVARALVAIGRRAEAMAMLARLEALVPPEAAAMRLNLSGGLLTQAAEAQDWADVASRSAAWLSAARVRGAGVNRGSSLQVASRRACALARLGREDDQATLVADLIAARGFVPGPALNYYACRDDLAAARELVVEALADVDRRGWALTVLQPGLPDAPALKQSEAEARFAARLRADPAVRAALAPVGRVLPTPQPGPLPADFDPLLEGPTPKPRPDSI